MSVGEISSQEYTIGSEDILTITFWQQPELNTTVRVNQSGMINLPVIGTITAAGLTPNLLAAKIVEKISLFNENISQASVVVTQYGSKKVYVTGHVMQPGKYAFEVIPDMWKILLETGGPTQTADLTNVQIIRGGADAGKSFTINLAEYLKKGQLSKLPPIYPDDTIHVPGEIPQSTTSVAQSIQPSDSTATAPNEEQKQTFYIYGQVIRPGHYPLVKNLNVLEAIVLAGGPTQEAKLDDVKIIIRGDYYSSVATVDLENYAKIGIPAPFVLSSGDMIYIPRQEASSLSGFFHQGSIFFDVLRIVVTATTSLVIYNLLL